MKHLMTICVVTVLSTAFCQDKPTRGVSTETPVRPDTLALFKSAPSDSSRWISDARNLKVMFTAGLDGGWKRVREWSDVARCSVLVGLYYETSDSSLHIYYENPDTLCRRMQTLFIK